ncbi:MAG: calcium/sodium antiporter [Pseudomonadota bacterium]|nr:calcium/sodium antiporter [Pseudomonadota bacterium]
MITLLAYLTIGFLLLIIGSHFFVEGAISIARNMKIPTIVIGLTIVAFATSAPEILVSYLSALAAESSLAIGNAIGSNTANIALVMGSMAIIRTISLDSLIIRNLMKALLLVSIIMIIPFFDNYLSQLEGKIILGGFLITMLWLLKFSLSLSKKENAVNAYNEDLPATSYSNMPSSKAFFILIFGLFILFYGADVVVKYAIEFAQELQIPETVIGITVVAIGTSLPELSVSITSAIKGEHGLAIGNIIGSNIFNLLAVVGLATAISPTSLPENMFSIHFFLMLTLTALLFFLTFRKENIIRKSEGIILLLIFLTYIGYIISYS